MEKYLRLTATVHYSMKRQPTQPSKQLLIKSASIHD
jgi:hypothetical protein